MAAPDASVGLAVRDVVQKYFNAARTGDIEAFKNFAKQLDGTDVKDANNRVALHFAAREGKIDMCKYLVEELKHDVNVKDDDGETPLLHAARQGHTLTAKYLLDCGADPTLPSQLGATALHHSAGIGDTDLLKVLISRGLDVDLQSDIGTPLIWAAGHGQQDAVRVLLEHKANPNLRTEDDVTPVLSAVAADSMPCLELLIQAGGDANVTAGGATALHIAADNGRPEMIECLLKGGADPNDVDEEGTKPIQVAAARGNRKAVEILFPVTSQIPDVPEWDVDVILEHLSSETDGKSKEDDESRQKNATIQMPEVEPEAKLKAAEAKARGDEAFKRSDIPVAVDAYTQAIDFDPSDGTLYSNRSLCWLRLGQADHALSDARACRALKPDWPKACYREGAALRLLEKFEEAATAFYEGVRLDPESMELVTAFREAVEAGRISHNKQQKS